MIAIPELPYELRELIWTEYYDGLRMRRADYIARMVLHIQIRTFCQTDENANINRLLDWMAHLLQFPNIKPQRGIVLVGPPRCGKTSFINFLAMLLGENHIWRSNTLRGRFNEHLEGISLIALEGCDVSRYAPGGNQLLQDSAHDFSGSSLWKSRGEVDLVRASDRTDRLGHMAL